MKPRPKAVYHLGTCLSCGGEGDKLTVPDNPVALNLCGDCLAFLIRDAAGTRSAIRQRWALVNRRAAAREARRRAELERKARADLERVLRMDEGNGRGL
jgi:hypothetical protein